MRARSSSLKINALGIDFGNPIGLAAGFDKNGQVFKQIIRQGFGFSEVGTVTPKAQSGNAKPRIFRLEKDEAIINSLGFNNDGLKLIINRLEKKRSDNIVGINLGVNYSSQNWFYKTLRYLFGLAFIDVQREINAFAV